MKTHTQEFEHAEEATHATKNVLSGFVIGGLIGAAATLLYAPKSGQETRAEIRERTMELRDRTAETVKDTVEQVKSKADQLKSEVQVKAGELKHQSREILSQQLDRVAHAAENGKKAIQET